MDRDWWRNHVHITSCADMLHSGAAVACTAADQLAMRSWQGSGKSTLVEQLVRLLRHTGRAAVDVSIDDFYLRFQVSIRRMCLSCQPLAVGSGLLRPGR
jgi:hypothetical protein